MANQDRLERDGEEDITSLAREPGFTITKITVRLHSLATSKLERGEVRN